MPSLILQTATRYLMVPLLLFSVLLLVRGHNEPGGGFTGGLMAAAAFCLCAVAYDAAMVRRLLRFDPVFYIGLGLCVAAGSGLISMMGGRPFMEATWGVAHVWGIGEIHLGTPFFFDLGVYFVVWGATLLVVLSLSEMWDGD